MKESSNFFWTIESVQPQYLAIEKDEWRKVADKISLNSNNNSSVWHIIEIASCSYASCLNNFWRRNEMDYLINPTNRKEIYYCTSHASRVNMNQRVSQNKKMMKNPKRFKLWIVCHFQDTFSHRWSFYSYSS